MPTPMPARTLEADSADLVAELGYTPKNYKRAPGAWPDGYLATVCLAFIPGRPVGAPPGG